MWKDEKDNFKQEKKSTEKEAIIVGAFGVGIITQHITIKSELQDGTFFQALTFLK